MLLGLLAVLVAAVSSAFASVYFEKMLKGRTRLPGAAEAAAGSVPEAKGHGGGESSASRYASSRACSRC